jgi:hypothetical protein
MTATFCKILNKKNIKPWTSEEDVLLKKYADEYEYRDWKAIAEFIPERSAIQCCARWKRIRPGVKKGKWTVQEDMLLMKFADKLNKKWSKIAKHIPNRTGKQIRDRYINTLDPAINKKHFSEEEDTKLSQLYQTVGPKWTKIAKNFPGRTGDSLKNRFYSCLNKISKKKMKFKIIKKRVPKNGLKKLSSPDGKNKPSQIEDDPMVTTKGNSVLISKDQEINNDKEINIFNSHILINEITNSENRQFSETPRFQQNNEFIPHLENLENLVFLLKMSNPLVFNNSMDTLIQEERILSSAEETLDHIHMMSNKFESYKELKKLIVERKQNIIYKRNFYMTIQETQSKLLFL